ncbi:hydantoinase/oxoprolinase family protein, partial [Komagataeibacter nataicola]
YPSSAVLSRSRFFQRPFWHIAMPCGEDGNHPISLIRNGRPAITRSAVLETVPIRLPVIDINAIGAGGGSIAWIDEGGALRVGPMSAEAIPGPACYGRGGTLPTVTDANIVLGRFDSQTRLGGDMLMDLQAAETAIRVHLAEPMGLSIAEAAAGVLRVAHANIVRGIRVVSVERGYDPRSFALVPFGGAGPMHCAPVARELRMKTILVPPTPGILCALGQLVSDLRHEVNETFIAAHADLAEDTVIARLEELRARGNALLAADSVPEPRRSIELRADVRYRGQSYELSIILEGDLRAAWHTLPEKFHEAHRQRFGHADPQAPIEIVGFGATAVGHIDAPALPVLPAGGEQCGPEAIRGERTIYFEGAQPGEAGAFHTATVYHREHLCAGNVIVGPAVIEEVSATTVLYPDDRAVVHPSGNIIVEVAL